MQKWKLTVKQIISEIWSKLKNYFTYWFYKFTPALIAVG